MLLLEYVFGIELDGFMLLGLMILMCFLASMGYSTWVLPGFTSSHVAAYGQCQNCYTGAFVFGFGQSVIYMTTNMFLPIAHIAHNALIVYSQMYQINLGSLTIVGG